MNILITICGRKGSKGVKNKNIKNFMGYPLVLYTISSALLFKEKYKKQFKNIDIGVNSDSMKLLEIAKKTEQCNIIKRPTELALDETPKLPVIKHTVQKIEQKCGITYSLIIDLDITTPLRRIDDIEKSLDICCNNDTLDLVFSVVKSRRNPYYNMVQLRNGLVEPVINTEFVVRQQTPDVYDMNASIYVYKRDSLINKLNKFFDATCGIHIMKDTGILDIDRNEDFELMKPIAEFFYKKYYEYERVYKTVHKLYQMINKPKY